MDTIAYVFEILTQNCEHLFISFYNIHRCYTPAKFIRWLIKNQIWQMCADDVNGIDFDCITVVLKV